MTTVAPWRPAEEHAIPLAHPERSVDTPNNAESIVAARAAAAAAIASREESATALPSIAHWAAEAVAEIFASAPAPSATPDPSIAAATTLLPLPTIESLLNPEPSEDKPAEGIQAVTPVAGTEVAMVSPAATASPAPEEEGATSDHSTTFTRSEISAPADTIPLAALELAQSAPTEFAQPIVTAPAPAILLPIWVRTVVAATPSPSPTVSPSPSATPKPTPEPTSPPEATPSPSPEPSTTPSPTAEPSATPAPSPTPEPTPEPTPAPSPSPEPSATPEQSPPPTPEPSQSPSPSPTASPEQSATPDATATPSPSPENGDVTYTSVSTRVTAGSGENTGMTGFVLTGEGDTSVVVRALGPSLTDAGVTDAVADPTLVLYDSTGAVVAANDNWRDSQATEFSAGGHAASLQPKSELEPAIAVSLPPGSYTTVVSGKNGIVGTAVIELYAEATSHASILASVSTRGPVQTDDASLVSGLSPGTGHDQGSTPVLIRGLGPSLRAQGVSNVISDPVLSLYDGNGSLLATNDNWDRAGQLQRTHLAPADPLESVIALSLRPGNYTVILNGNNHGIGIGLLEIYFPLALP
ncbi:MAG: hypothetical protein ABI839_07420 [Verrucomicrobiota bacterium]